MGEKESQKKRYALVGTGGRSSFYYTAIATDYKATSEIVGLCDTNQTRMNVANDKLESLGHGKVPTFLAVDFDKMITTLKPDEVIVTAGPDRLHNIYIVRAMELGCNVVTEKPSEFACTKLYFRLSQREDGIDPFLSQWHIRCRLLTTEIAGYQ
jgi:predicted dehydrogenase